MNNLCPTCGRPTGTSVLCDHCAPKALAPGPGSAYEEYVRTKFNAFARRILEQQHVSPRLKQSRLACFDLAIDAEHDLLADDAYDAACRIIHIG